MNTEAQKSLGAAMGKIDNGIHGITMLLHNHGSSYTEGESAILISMKLELCDTLEKLERFYKSKYPMQA